MISIRKMLAVLHDRLAWAGRTRHNSPCRAISVIVRNLVQSIVRHAMGAEHFEQCPLVALACAREGGPPRAGVTPRNASRNSSGETPSPAATSTTGRPPSRRSVSCPPENLIGIFMSSADSPTRHDASAMIATSIPTNLNNHCIPEDLDSRTPEKHPIFAKNENAAASQRPAIVTVPRLDSSLNETLLALLEGTRTALRQRQRRASGQSARSQPSCTVCEMSHVGRTSIVRALDSFGCASSKPRTSFRIFGNRGKECGSFRMYRLLGVWLSIGRGSRQRQSEAAASPLGPFCLHASRIAGLAFKQRQKSSVF